MSYRRKRRSGSLTTGLRGLVSFCVLFIAMGFLFVQLFSSVWLALGIGSLTAVRSLAAAILPLLVAVYLGYIARLRVPANESRAPLINGFIIYTFWTMLVLSIDETSEYRRFPLEELLYSSTLAFMIWRYRYHNSFKSLLARSYGVVAGALGAVILFGMDLTAF